MEWELVRWTPVFGRNAAFCLFSLLLSTAGAETSHSHSTLSVSAPHVFYSCPEGALVKLECAQRGAALHPTDELKHIWLYSARPEKHCTGGTGPRNLSLGHGNHVLPPGVRFGHGEHSLWVELKNVTFADQGRYCCLVLDIEKNSHKSPAQKAHSHIILSVTPGRNGPQNCTILDPTPAEGYVPVALAIAACVLALLSLPLILVLVYKQRHNAQSSRRAQELVRMDSEALGHENPVFLGGSPQAKTRTVSQIMTRQSSETGRHLLSDPGTPLSPPGHGDVFFPSEDTILESPDFMQV